MTNAGQSAVHRIDSKAGSVNPCAWCQHFEFIHANNGLCLFSECTCPFFVPRPPQTIEASGDPQ